MRPHLQDCEVKELLGAHLPISFTSLAGGFFGTREATITALALGRARKQGMITIHQEVTGVCL